MLGRVAGEALIQEGRTRTVRMHDCCAAMTCELAAAQDKREQGAAGGADPPVRLLPVTAAAADGHDVPAGI